MPIVDVSYSTHVPDAVLHLLARDLPDEVSRAVACAEEPYEPPLGPGDVEIRFRARGPFDVTGLDLLVEVRSKWFASRADDRQARTDQLLTAVTRIAGTASVGVYLTVPVAAWAQG